MIPPLPGISAFPEVNLRTYVSYRGHRGVWFLSLDAADRLAVEVARRVFHLPYHRAQMACTPEQDGWVTYANRRIDSHGPGAAFAGRYRPIGPVDRAQPGSRAHFLTARDGLWSLDRGGKPAWVGIRHSAWPLQPAELELEAQTLSATFGIDLARPPDDLRFSHRLDSRGMASRPAVTEPAPPFRTGATCRYLFRGRTARVVNQSVNRRGPPCGAHHSRSCCPSAHL